MPHTTVKCVNATGLRSTQTFGKQDPYVKIGAGRVTRKTRVDENGHKTPTWNQTLELGNLAPGQTLEVVVWNQNSLSDNVIGTGSCSVGAGGARSVSVPLRHKGKSAGLIHLVVNVAGAAAPPPPAPVVRVPSAVAMAGMALFQEATGQGESKTPGGGGMSRHGSARFVSTDKSTAAGGAAADTSYDVPIPLGAGNDLKVGLGWDFADVDGDGQGDTDLDLSCVAFDARGQFLKACYFAEPNPFGNGAVFHTGDNRDGKGDGDDESVTLDLDKLVGAGVSALFFCVNSFNGSNFRAVKTAHSRVVSTTTNAELSRVHMALEDRRATSLVSGRLARNASGSWVFRPLAISGKNSCFADVVPTMQAQLRDILPRVKVAPPPTGIIMTKGESLPVPSNTFTVGLGWDQVGAAVDLDASVVCLGEGASFKEACFFGKLKCYGGGLAHSGDNRSGAGAGDDESIQVNLSKIPRDVSYVVVVVNCYDNVPLQNVRNAYVRLVNAQGAQTHRYQLDSLGQASGYIMATLYRSARGAWMLKTNSQEGMGNTFKKMLPAIQVACRNLLSKHV